MKDKSTTEYAGQFDYTRMFERDPVNANALSRWHRADEPTGLQVSLSKGYFSFRWFNPDQYDWYSDDCGTEILSKHTRLNNEGTADVINIRSSFAKMVKPSRNNSRQEPVKQKINCKYEIATDCDTDIELQFNHFSSDCAMGKIEVHFRYQGITRIQEICGQVFENENSKVDRDKVIEDRDIESNSLHYPFARLKGTNFFLSFRLVDVIFLFYVFFFTYCMLINDKLL